MTTKKKSSHFLSHVTLFGLRDSEQTNLADALFGLALGKRDKPKVVCLNSTEGSY